MGPGYPMIPTAALTAPRDMTAVQPTPVAPPNMGGGAQPPLSYYEQLMQIYNDAVRLSHKRGDSSGRSRRDRLGFKYSKAEIDDYVQDQASTMFKGAHNFRTLDHLVRTIQELDRQGKRPISESDLTPIEKGAIARTGLFGQSVLPFADEIAGVVAARPPMLLPGGVFLPGGPGYKAGRDEQRRYMRNARRFALADEMVTRQGVRVPGDRGILANPETWGAPAGALATMGVASPASMMSLRLALGQSALRSPQTVLGAGGVGALFSGGHAAGDVPEWNRESLKENAIPIAANAALGGAMGMAGEVGGRSLVSWLRPGADRLAKTLEVVERDAPGGLAGVMQRAAARGVENPMLAELGETSFARLGNAIRMGSQEAQTAAANHVGAQLQAVKDELKAISAQYDQVLQGPVGLSDESLEALRHPRVKALLKEMIDDGDLVPGQLTGRALEDVRQALDDMADAAFDARNARVGKRLDRYTQALMNDIDTHFAAMPEMRATWRSVRARQISLKQMHDQLVRRVRGAAGAPPIEKKVTTAGEIAQDYGSEGWQRTTRGAVQMVDPLYTPAGEAVHRARLRLPWYSAFTPQSALTGAATLPQVNPFFQIQPDSTQQEP